MWYENCFQFYNMKRHENINPFLRPEKMKAPIPRNTKLDKTDQSERDVYNSCSSGKCYVIQFKG